MTDLLSRTLSRIRVLISSTRRPMGIRWGHKTLFALAGICVLLAARPGTMSVASGAIRDYAARARIAFSMADPDTLAVFGPKQFVTAKSNTQINFVESFSVPPLPASGDTAWAPAPNQYTIRLQRVGGSLATATVSINGTQVATAADFSTATVIERVITVNQTSGNTNSLTISLKGAAAAGLIARIVGVPDATFSIFGPKLYAKGVTTPSQFTETFTLPMGAFAPYAVSARSSVAGTKATITVNGVQVIKDADFGTNGTFVIRQALISGNNTMQVAVRGTTGSTITVTVFATDKTPPTLTIAAPPANFVTKANSLVVSGTSQDTERTQVKVNGVVATMSGPQFTEYSATVPLTAGLNSIAIQATDKAGNHTDSTRTVTRDAQAPTLTVTSPVDGSFTTQTAVTVAGTASDVSAVTVKVNGVSYPVGEGGGFTGSYQLAAGANFITITATDASGNEASEIRKVTRDLTAPVVTITTPIDGSYSNATAINVSGTASDDGPVTVKVNGAAATVNPDGSFNHSLTLVAGTNAVSVIATDGAGNATTVSRTVIQDRDSPVVGADYPDWTNLDTAVIVVTTTDASPITVTLDGGVLTAGADGKFRGTVTLTEGDNDGMITVTDAAGNSETYPWALIRDATSPVITLTAPAEGAHFESGPAVVSGTMTDAYAAKVELTVNGVSVDLQPVEPDPPVHTAFYFSTSVTLSVGSNPIVIVARDAAGNTRTLTRTVTFGPAGGGVPPDPSTVAPALNPTFATTTFAATSFLYTGPNPIQTGVAEGTIQPLQAAVVRGTVRTRTGSALPAVTVSVLDHPELGQTLSRADGGFDLVVNGRDALTLNFQKTGFLPAQRQSSVAWQEYAVMEPVTLVSLDPSITTVDFSQAAQAAQGTVVTDESGTRQATMIFKGGTQASLKMPNGTLQPVSSISVRATEYTVGPTGPSAMPAPLPATSAYTYAVELSADEAIAAGATSVVFDRPVAFYVDNFLHFAVGEPVPVGYYDRQKAVWVATPNGRIVKVLQVAGGRASLDVDGSNTEASPQALAALGVDEAELMKLGTLYTAGKSLWRVQISHFTPYDLNWPPARDSTSVPPQSPNPGDNKAEEKDCNKKPGSVIGCERQTLGERIALAGTSLQLNYQSDGSRGYKDAYAADIVLIGAIIPQNLQRITLEVRIAGRLFTQTFGPQANQSTRFVWDGKDAYGRLLQGSQPARIRIGYTYPSTNYARTVFQNLSGNFGAYGSAVLTGDLSRSEATLWQDMLVRLGSRGTLQEGLGGWRINVHHYYDPMGRVVHLGDGSRRTGTALFNSTTTLAGTDPTANFSNLAKAGDRAVDAYLGAPGMAVAGDGTIYINDDANNKIWHVNASGILEHVGGNGTIDFSGDGIPATSAGMIPNSDLSIGPDNSVYFLDNSRNPDNLAGGRVRRIDRNGIITTVAGSGICGTTLPDGTLATQANLCFIDFTLAKDGTIYAQNRTEVYRVGGDGIITRIVGDGSGTRCPSTTASYVCAEGKPASATGVFTLLRGIAVGADGTLYLANIESFNQFQGMIIYRIGPDGIIRRVAGNGANSGLIGDGLPATNAILVSRNSNLAVGADGTPYFTATSGRVYRVDEKGLLRILVACISNPGPATCSRDSGGPATLTTLSGPRSVGFGPDGRLHIADRIVRRIDAPLPVLGINITTVASDDGSQLYVFSADGRHLRTLDAVLGHAIYEFTYEPSGLLSTIRDVDGNTVVVERDGSGAPTAIVAPFGQRTELTLTPEQYLATVTRPGEPATVLTYSTDGLLKTFTFGAGNLHEFGYDDNGLLIRDDDPAGGFKTLSRAVTDSSSAVTVTTALGKSNVHGTTRLSIGTTSRRTVGASGLATTSVRSQNGTITQTAPDGTVTTMATGGDPRFGMQAPVLNRITVRAPSGLLSTVTAGRRAVLSDPANPMSLVSKTDSVVVNGRIFRNTYVAATRTSTSLSPMGRSNTDRVDASGRVVEQATPGITPIQFQYDPRGRLSQVAQDTLRWTYSYNPRGRLETLTDPLTRSSQYFYDAADRLTRQVLADSREVLYEYDSIGNLRSVTPPGRPAHGFQHNSVDLVTSYDPPSVGAGSWSTTYQYDVDRKLTQIARPGGQTIGFGYDTAGRPSSVTVPGGLIQYTYHSGSGNLTGVTGAYGGSLSFSYDGSLPTGVTWSGEVSGSVTATYNNNLQVNGIAVNGAAPVAFVYDNDGLLRQAGDLTINRNTINSLITGTTLGSVTTTQSYTPFGMLDRLTASVSGNALLDVTYTRDALGRLKEFTEALSGTTTVKGFTYDLAGRLKEVRENGTLAAVYDYDSSGNRLSATRPSGVENGTHDAQDRLLSYGAASFGYTAGGELKFKAVGTDTTRYSYDALGNLREVQMVDGTQINYVVDAFNRRIGKKVNGVLVQGFLYQSQLSPVAELDGVGNVVSRFVYGTRGNVPNYLVKAGVTYRLVTDHLGSVRLVVNVSTDSVVQRIHYDEFGRVTQNTNPGFQPFGFAGGLLDAHTSLVRFGARDYDAQVGRWTAKDPIGFEGGDTQFYGYAANDPVNRIDPTGQFYDFIDVAFFAESLYNFLNCPSWGNAGDLGLNGLGLLPGVPSLGLVRKLDDVTEAALKAGGKVERSSDAAKAADHNPWEWRGGDKGSWYNTETREYIWPNLDHKPPIGPHYDYRDQAGKMWRIDPNTGAMTPKK